MRRLSCLFGVLILFSTLSLFLSLFLFSSERVIETFKSARVLSCAHVYRPYLTDVNVHGKCVSVSICKIPPHTHKYTRLSDDAHTRLQARHFNTNVFVHQLHMTRCVINEVIIFGKIYILILRSVKLKCILFSVFVNTVGDRGRRWCSRGAVNDI